MTPATSTPYSATLHHFLERRALPRVMAERAQDDIRARNRALLLDVIADTEREIATRQAFIARLQGILERTA